MIKIIKKLLTKLKNIISNMIFIPKCSFCRNNIDVTKDNSLCETCMEGWEDEKSILCNYCLKPHTDCNCKIYGDRSSIIEKSIHLIQYNKTKNFIGKSLILKIKKENNKKLVHFFAHELSNIIKTRLNNNYVEAVIVHVPRLRKNVRKYGFDHMELVAHSLSKELNIPCVKAISHKRGGLEQKTLDFKNRVENTKNSYTLLEKNKNLIYNKNIILIDDIITTGSSILACADILKNNECKKIYCVVIAKTSK